jgi:23S rRNA pseudouridine1911/1915/1917 synthase
MRRAADSTVVAVVPRALDGQRLDRVVAIVTGCSRSEAAALVDAGGVTVGGRPVTTRSHRVAEGDALEVVAADRPAPEALVPDPTVDVPVVYEDADLLVVDKPAGLVVHPGAGQHAGTLVHGLFARYP